MLWNEARNWDAAAKRPIPIAAVLVTVALTKPVSVISVYDPVNAAAPVQRITAPTNTITLPLADRLQVLELGA